VALSRVSLRRFSKPLEYHQENVRSDYRPRDEWRDEIQRALGRLEAKVDLLLSEQSRHAVQHAESEKRIGELEKSLAQTKTVGGIVAFLVTTVAALLPTFWNKS
jgi:chromosome segregation ATPase